MKNDKFRCNHCKKTVSRKDAVWERFNGIGVAYHKACAEKLGRVI